MHVGCKNLEEFLREIFSSPNLNKFVVDNSKLDKISALNYLEQEKLEEFNNIDVERLIKNGQSKVFMSNENFVAKRQNWSFLDWNENGKPRSYEDAIFNASKYLKDSILTELVQEKYSLLPDEAPRREVVREINSGFIRALDFRKLKYGDIVKEANLLIKRFDFSKAEISFFKKHDIKYRTLIHRYDWLINESLAIDFFQEVIYPIFNRIPTEYEIEKAGFSGYWSRAYNTLGLTLNNIIIGAGFSPNIEYMYSYAGWDIEKHIEFFYEIILPNLRLKHKFGLNEIPKSGQIDNSEFRGFRKSLKRLGYTYNDFVKYLGFEPHWEVIYTQTMYKGLLNYFIEIIYPDLSEIFELDENEAPSYEEVEKYYRGFLNSILRFNKSYSDVVNDLNLNSRQIINQRIGILNHDILKLFIPDIINRQYNTPIYLTETEIFYPQQGFRIDALIILYEVFLKHMKSRFKKLIEEIPELRDFLSNFYNLLASKDYLLIDFSLGFFKRNKLHKNLVARKTLKYRNLPNSLFLLVGTRWDSYRFNLELPSSIRYKTKQVKMDDTRVVSPFLFEKIIGIPENHTSTFYDIIQLSAEKEICSLEQLLKKYEQKNIKNFGTEDFIRLRKQKTLDYFSL